MKVLTSSTGASFSDRVMRGSEARFRISWTKATSCGLPTMNSLKSLSESSRKTRISSGHVLITPDLPEEENDAQLFVETELLPRLDSCREFAVSLAKMHKRDDDGGMSG